MGKLWQRIKNKINIIMNKSDKKQILTKTPTTSTLSGFEECVQKILLCQTGAHIGSLIDKLAPDIRSGKTTIEEAKVLNDLVKEQLLVIKSGFYEEKWIGLSYSDKKELIDVSRRLIPKSRFE